MTGMPQLCAQDNFQRAWRWLRSNPDANYKSYFRDIYRVYAVADEVLLDDLRDRVRRGVYQPKHSTKLFAPKPSGILRPYSLLDIEDQIVYQACANIIAEQLVKKNRSRYYVETFGNLYAGKTSTWFYRSWSKGYSSFNQASRKAFSDGYDYTANFDLTACYDSIDHGVLRHFLLDIKCQPDFIDAFIGWLSVWTATDRGYYLNHGIPQGPLSSGIISEVVLRHFDEKRNRNNKKIKYFRYVDDIKLFAKDESELRKSLVQLDLLSKDIGLFPQGSKISIHKVKDIEDELKTVSNPQEVVVVGKTIDKDKLYKRIVELTPKYKISNPTRFKYLLAHAEPNGKLTARLWKIYEKQPEIYLSFTRYLERYKKFPKTVEARVLEEIKNHKLYDSIVAAFINSANGRVTGSSGLNAIKIVKSRWKPRANLPDLQAAAAKWLIEHDSFSFASCQTAVFRSNAWWARAAITFELDDNVIGTPSLENIINQQLRTDCPNTALAAVNVLDQKSLALSRPITDINPVAGKVLRQLGHIRRAPGTPCFINESINRMAKCRVSVNWKKLFGNNYKAAEKQIIQCRAYVDTDINGWINALDVFIDRLLAALFSMDTAIGGYTLGRIGSALSPTSRFALKYPETFKLAETVHDLRLTSDLSHPLVKLTGKPTRRLKYSDSRVVIPMLRLASNEIKSELNL
ncbi:MAG: hypothetical protein GY770_22490 [Aestuariibacter sp.]|nr:hypothetical protein [Aestuariibacter sp.]